MNPADKFEVPNNVREMAERSIEQARQAHAQFVDVARQATDMMAKSQEASTSGALDIQRKAMEFADHQVAANFALAEELAKADSMQSALELQQRFASEQMQNFTQQSQELAEMMVQVSQKVQMKPE